jgi:ferritin-like protein
MGRSGKEVSPVSTVYHEPTSELSEQARDVHRALATTIEELEAIDWYHQRADVCKDESLKAIILHHRDEEIEHAVMGLEWLRRTIPKFDEELRTYLFTDGPIHAHEEQATGEGVPTKETAGSGLDIGSLKKGD